MPHTKETHPAAPDHELTRQLLLAIGSEIIKRLPNDAKFSVYTPVSTMGGHIRITGPMLKLTASAKRIRKVADQLADELMVYMALRQLESSGKLPVFESWPQEGNSKHQTTLWNGLTLRLCQHPTNPERVRVVIVGRAVADKQPKPEHRHPTSGAHSIAEDQRAHSPTGPARPIPKPGTFAQGLRDLINRHGREGGSDTPDYILATYVEHCLMAFDAATRRRTVYYGQARPFNRHGREGGSDTPDYILATYVEHCLMAFDAATRRRTVYYGQARPFTTDPAE